MFNKFLNFLKSIFRKSNTTNKYPKKKPFQPNGGDTNKPDCELKVEVGVNN
jgi:hypothetical protein